MHPIGQGPTLLASSCKSPNLNHYSDFPEYLINSTGPLFQSELHFNSQSLKLL